MSVLNNIFGNIFANIFSSCIKSIEYKFRNETTLASKYNCGSKKIHYGANLKVNKNQIAILVQENKLADIFFPGIYLLDNSGAPLLSKLQNWDGNENPFEADIYFFSTENETNVSWNTSKNISVKDKKFGKTSIKVAGSYSLSIENIKYFLIQMLENKFDINVSINNLTQELLEGLAKEITSSKVELVELLEGYQNILRDIKNELGLKVLKQGFKLKKLNISKISLPQDVKNKVLNAEDKNVEIKDIIEEEALQKVEPKLEEVKQQETITTKENKEKIIENVEVEEIQPVIVPQIEVNENVQKREKIYYLMIMGERKGPYSIIEIDNMIEEKSIDISMLVWSKRFSGWISIEKAKSENWN